MKTTTLILSSLLLVSCASDQTSQNLYSSKDIGKSISIKSCTVISARQVIIRDGNSGDKGESLGFIAGGLASNSDKPINNFLGGLIGGAIGRNLSDSLHEREGVEYTVILANGDEQQLVQDIGPEEYILSPQSPCRLQSNGHHSRVLSAEHYPNRVNRPQPVQFNNE